MLLTVQAVGPKVALAVLSVTPPQELVAVLAAGDADRLRAVPGHRQADRRADHRRAAREGRPRAVRGAGRVPIVARRGDARADPRALARAGLIELGYGPEEAEELLARGRGGERRGADRPRPAPGTDGRVSAMTEAPRPASRRPTWSPRTSSTARCARAAWRSSWARTACATSSSVAIEAAAARGEELDHLLLAGPPGLGKTSLAQIVAAELEVPFVATAGPALERKGDIAAFLTALEPRSVFFVDEIHRLARTLEETFYPAMEDRRLPITVGQGAGARVVTLELPPFTLVGATTRTGLLEHAAARPLRHPGAPGALHRGGAGGDRAPLGAASSRSTRRRRGRSRSPPAAAAPRGSPTACSSGSATTPRCASTASSAPTPRARRWRCWRSTALGLDRLDRRILEAICVQVRRRAGGALDAGRGGRRGAGHDRGRVRALSAAAGPDQADPPGPGGDRGGVLPPRPGARRRRSGQALFEPLSGR